MKIAFIGGRNIHKLGGIESYMLNLCTELVKLGHEPVVFCESEFNGVEELNGFTVIHQLAPKSNIICKPYLGLKATLKVVRKMKDVDVIHYNAWPPSLWNPIARMSGFTTLMQGHGLEWQRTKYNRFQQLLMRMMEGFTAYWNPNLIMCSEAQVKYFKKKYHRNAEAVPTAINPPETNIEGDKDVLAKWGVEPGEYYLFMARLVEDKNPETLIKAFKEANTANKKLVIAGDNEARPDYVEMLHCLADGCERIVFTGAVYDNDKNALLRNASTFCLVSSIEGLSISLLEAMSYSLPIIASDIEANREVLDSTESFWVKPEDVEGLKDVLESVSVMNKEEMQRIGKANFNKVIPNYTWHEVAKKYVDYISRLQKSK